MRFEGRWRVRSVREGRELEGMVDEEGETTTVTVSVFANNRVVREDRRRMGGVKFSFLDGSHGDVVLLEKGEEFSGFRKDSIDVQL